MNIFMQQKWQNMQENMQIKTLFLGCLKAFYAIIIKTLISGNQLMSQNVSPITIMAPKFNGKG